MKHTIEKPIPIPIVLSAAMNLDSPLRENEQTCKIRINKTPM